MLQQILDQCPLSIDYLVGLEQATQHLVHGLSNHPTCDKISVHVENKFPIKDWGFPTSQGQKEANGQKTSRHHSQFYRCDPLPTLSTHPIYPSFRSYHHPPKTNKLSLACLKLLGLKNLYITNQCIFSSKAFAFYQSLIYLFTFSSFNIPSTYFSSLK